MASTLSRGTGTDRAPAGSRRRDGRRAHGRSVVVLAAVSVVLAYALVVLGSTVRVTESGMGCPSWPLCYGHLGLVGNIHAWL
ncbi:MAG: COX15/CtaA family protein, partial [Actinomycetota bacterium]|nr:COX15/CtaA family protein [Actinomycetota bacterium]